MVNPPVPGRIQKKIVDIINSQSSAGYDVWDVAPDRDNPDIYQFAGNPVGIANQISLFMAIREYEENKFGRIDLKEFIRDFESCWTSINKSEKWTGTDKSLIWGNDRGQAPKFEIRNKEGDSDNLPSKGYYLVEFWPNRDEKDNAYLLGGSAINIVNQAFQIMQNMQILESGNIGRLIGEPVTDYIRRLPYSGAKIRIYFNKKKGPKFDKNNAGYITIPYPDLQKLTYQNIRTICGGTQGINWGKKIAKMWIIPGQDYVANNKRNGEFATEMRCGGATEEGAIQNLERFKLLTQGVVAKRNYSETLTGASIQLDQRFNVYPRNLVVLNSRLVKLEDTSPGIKTLVGKLNSKENDLPLWYDREPPGWGNMLKDFLKWD